MTLSNTGLADAVTYIESRWGYDKSWENWMDFYPDFAPYTNGALKEALHGWFRAGNRFGPKPSELLKAVAEVQRRRIDTGVDTVTAACEAHTWALPFPQDLLQTKVCARCGVEA